MTDKLFIRYNKVMQKVFEKAMDEVTTKEQYFSVITRAREQFEKETIDGLSVERSLRNDIEKEGIDNVLDMALTVCDMYLPYSLITILHESIGTEGIKHKILDETRPEAERARGPCLRTVRRASGLRRGPAPPLTGRKICIWKRHTYDFIPWTTMSK